MLEDVYGQLHSLSDFLDVKNYKTYDELKAKLNKVLGVTAGATAESYMETAPSVTTNEFVPEAAATEAPTAEASSDDEDTLSYFAKLANS